MRNSLPRMTLQAGALCITVVLLLSGCDKIDELRDTFSNIRGGTTGERGGFMDRRARSLRQLAQPLTTQTASSNQAQGSDIIARSVTFIPNGSTTPIATTEAGKPGVLQATFDNTFGVVTDVVVKIAVDGAVVSEGSTSVPARSRWSYSVPYTFTAAGEHSLGMGVYLKGGMPVPEADVMNNEVSGLLSVSQASNAQAAGGDKATVAAANGEPARTTERNDIEARSIGFMPKGSDRYTSQAVAGQEGVLRTTFANGFDFDVNLIVKIADEDSALADVMLAVPAKSQGAYFYNHTFEKPGIHKVRLSVYPAGSSFSERNLLNNEMVAVINVVSAGEAAAKRMNAVANDIIARGVSFEPESAPASSGPIAAGALGRMRIDYTSTFAGYVDLTVTWLIDNATIAELPLKGVGPGDHSASMSYAFDLPGKHTIGAKITLADGNKQPEADTNNNVSETTVDVVPAEEIVRTPAPMLGGVGAALNSMPGPSFAPVDPAPQAAVAGPLPVADTHPVVSAGSAQQTACDLVAEGIQFMASPGDVPATNANAGQGGYMSYVIKNKTGAVNGVTVKIKLDLNGKTKFSLVKRIDIQESGILEGATGNIVLSEPGRYMMSLSADHPNVAGASGGNGYSETKNYIEVRPRTPAAK